MTTSRRTALAIASVCVAINLSGCCVTSITSRKGCQAPCQQAPTYESIPQGIGPVEGSPMIDPAPAPPPTPIVPPSPNSANRGAGTKTTMMMRQMGDSMRETFTR